MTDVQFSQSAKIHESPKRTEDDLYVLMVTVLISAMNDMTYTTSGTIVRTEIDCSPETQTHP